MRLQARGLALQRLKRSPNLADGAARPGGESFRQRLAAHNQRAREHDRQIVAAGAGGRFGVRIVARQFAYRFGFAGEQRFVGQQVPRFKDEGVGGYAVALGQRQYVAAHNLPARDAQAPPLPHNQRARAGEVAQSLQHALGAVFLHNGDDYGHAGERQQDEGFARIAQRQIDRAASQQQEQHRLARDVVHDAQQGPLAAVRQFVRPLSFQPRCSLGIGEAGIRGSRGGVIHGAANIGRCGRLRWARRG